MGEYNLKKFDFIKKKEHRNVNDAITSHYSNIGGGHYSTIVEHRTPQPRVYYENEIQTFNESSTFSNSMTHTLSEGEVKNELKVQMMRNVFENMVREDMFEFYEMINPSTFGMDIKCRLKVVKPHNNVTGRHNP